MILFISGEIDNTISENEIDIKFRRTRRAIEDEINKVINNKTYGDRINKICLVPMILQSPNELFDQKNERKLIKHKEKIADYRLRINYKEFNTSDEEVRKKLLLKNIIDAIVMIGKRINNDFNYEELINDILNIWNYKEADIKTIRLTTAST